MGVGNEIVADIVARQDKTAGGRRALRVNC